MLTAVMVVALLIAGDRIAKAIGFILGFTFNLGLLLFTAALRLTIKG